VLPRADQHVRDALVLGQRRAEQPGEAGPALVVPPCGEVPSPAPSSRASGAAWWPASGASGAGMAAATALFAVGAGAVAGRARTLRDES